MPHSSHPFVWTLLASFGGALTALSFRPFKDMTRWEIVLALTAGASFAIFVGPWAAKLIFGDGPVDARILGGLYYMMATGSNVLIPVGVKWLGSFFGVKNEEKPK
ncbi:MAG: hypothetical protein QOH47_2420 [Sphingomonadales bacterium]|jgi:hypothetical protein|nr:hypothetical protein [Sphingomonadales bacterium]